MDSHLSASPNQQIDRKTSLNKRGSVAMGGNFRYELNLLKLNNEEKETSKR